VTGNNPRADAERAAHPKLAAGLLMGGITLLLVLLAAASL